MHECHAQTTKAYLVQLMHTHRTPRHSQDPARSAEEPLNRITPVAYPTSSRWSEFTATLFCANPAIRPQKKKKTAREVDPCQFRPPRVAGSLTLTSKGVARIRRQIRRKRPIGAIAISAPPAVQTATPLLHMAGRLTRTSLGNSRMRRNKKAACASQQNSDHQ